MPLTWFKVKRQSVLDDPIIGILSDSAFRRYYQLTALCTELDNNGHLDEAWTEEWLSWRFRVSQEQIAADLKELQEAGLLDDLALACFADDQRRKPSDEPEATRERKRLERERQKEALVTPLSHPVTPQEEEEEEEKREEKKKNTRSSKSKEPSQKQQEARAMFSALATVCQIDLKTLVNKQRDALNQSEKRLRSAGATPADMEPFATWWYANDWRGKKGDVPRPAQVRETWGQFKAWREGGQNYGKRTQSTDPRAPNYRPPLISLNA